MTEKKLWTLKVDEEFKALIPPLTEEEHRMLEESIVRDGCDTPLTVWEGTIVDGHNRYNICQAHGIPFAYEERHFEDKDAAIFWMLEHQLARRNLNSYQRTELALVFEPMLKGKAKEQQGTRNDLSDFRQNSVGSSPDSYSDRKMAKIAGVSHDTVRKVRAIKKSADDETKQQLRRGEKSIHKAYTELMNKEHEGETRVCERCRQEKPLSAFSMPSDRTTYSALCTDCEHKVEEAAKEAAKVASETMEPVETYPVQGMALYKGHPIHIGSAPEDKPEMFTQVQGLLDFAVHGFLSDVREAMNWFGPNMRTPENVEKVESLIMNTCESALKLLRNDVENTNENGEEN